MSSSVPNFSVALKLPPSPGDTNALVTAGDKLRRAINALGHADGDVGASRWFRKAFAELEAEGFYHFTNADLPPETRERVTLSETASLAAVGHHLEHVFQQGGGIALTMWVEHRAVFVTATTPSGTRENALTVRPTDTVGGRGRAVRRAAGAFRDHFPSTLECEDTALPSWSRLHSGLTLTVERTGDTVTIGSNGFGRPRPASRVSPSTTRFKRSVDEF